VALPLWLLDTTVLIALISGKALGQYIDATYQLRASPIRPLACIVSHGELWALARVNNFGEAKRAAIATMLANVVTVDISDESVVEAYVEVYAALRGAPGGSRTNVGENDLWIAAATRATAATLLTTDADFDPLFPGVIQRVYISRAMRLPGVQGSS